MNDNFLYELRTPPSPEFASRLKARLDLQANEARQRRRSVRWFVFGAILMGGTALALVSPSVRQAAWTMIVQLRGSPVPAAREETLARSSDVAVSRPPVDDAESANIIEPDSSSAEPTSMEPRRAAPTEERASEAPTGVSAPANSAASVVVADGPRTSVVIGHTESLQTLAENLATDLEDRLKTTRIDTTERAARAKLCTLDTDLLLSDRQLLDDKRFGCPPRSRIVEVRLAYDPLVLIVNRENTWSRTIVPAELAKFRETYPSSSVTTWSQIRPEWPTLPMSLVGTSLDQSEAGKRFAHVARLTRSASVQQTSKDDPDTTRFVQTTRKPTALEVTKDDRATMRVVEDTLGAIGYIRWLSLDEVLREHSGWPTTVAIVSENGEAVAPEIGQIQEGRYPLAQPLWLYVDVNRMGRFEVWSVLQELLARGASKTIERSGFVSVGANERQAGMRTLMQARSDATHY
jgi:ABC-type phosphate transport system substrate-binding protein